MLVERVDALLGAMTSHEEQPQLHYWNSHREAKSWPSEKIADLHLAVARVLRPAFAAVIADHIESGNPMVMEGDYLTPDLALTHAGAVRAVVLDEPDEDQLVVNYQGREPQHNQQRQPAQVSVHVGARLASRAHHAGVPVVLARPRANHLDRIDRALRAPTPRREP